MDAESKDRVKQLRNADLGLAVVLATVLTGCTGGVSGAPNSGGSAGANQEVGTAASGLDEPWSIAVLPDGSALISENNTGLIKHVVDGETVAAVPVESPLETTGEGGLLGLELSPNFDADARLYVYLTSPEDNRVVSYRWKDGQLSDGREIVTGIPKAGNHNGGRIKFGPDDYLYIATGDAAVSSRSQDRSSLGGKILRVTADGDPAPGNPFGDSPVYSYGHRNVQGLAWDADGRLWATEFGPDRDDELNLIEAGGNYGWPEVTGAPGDDRFIDAKVVWPSTADASPSGMALVDGTAWIAALRGQRLWKVELDGTSAGEPEAFYEGEFGRLRDVVAAPGGGLWVLTNGTDNDRMLAVPVK
ncbi:PQQ-dependent sugar dehydrogenase [Arthrobacter sp. CAU 1506]|uniref:PQQ-dependent sugar dehydrogenase n=1 Tax=Arthrobacter sp. CAU 1506 TaxID=2560052 RepID=UPI0010ACA3E5|nr:PQQ-dependent sugar dehydrogenase [Arthrobacter sp. CAU 1506]TJY68874.1 PQQ-dependent sugar dehydrogenase [Arthrobacter sp. CAU 1506]